LLYYTVDLASLCSTSTDYNYKTETIHRNDDKEVGSVLEKCLMFMLAAPSGRLTIPGSRVFVRKLLVDVALY